MPLGYISMAGRSRYLTLSENTKDRWQMEGRMKVCPKCGSHDTRQTYAGYVPPNPDRNRAWCSCGWKGEVCDMMDMSKQYGAYEIIRHRRERRRKTDRLIKVLKTYLPWIPLNKVVWVKFEGHPRARDPFTRASTLAWKVGPFTDPPSRPAPRTE